jgi:hypothetical protein
MAVLGARHYFVASNDPKFALVAEFGHVYVVTRDERLVSRRLARAASGVFQVYPAADAWCFNLHRRSSAEVFGRTLGSPAEL